MTFYVLEDRVYECRNKSPLDSAGIWFIDQTTSWWSTTHSNQRRINHIRISGDVNILLWNNIVLCCLSFHILYKLQPYDVDIFGPLKMTYRKQVEQLFVTTWPHLDDLITFGPSNDLITGEHQPDPFDILLTGERMDSEGEVYLPYEEMSPGELDSYYFRSD